MAEETADQPESKKKRKKKALVIPALVLLLGLGGGGYFFLESKKSDQTTAAETTTTTEYGKIVRLQPITLNLSDGKVLKVGLALAVVAEPKDEELKLLMAPAEGKEAKKEEGIPNSPLAGHEALALNEAILSLGDMTYDELSKPGARAEAKKELAEKIEKAYHGDVVKIYFTEFVMA